MCARYNVPIWICKRLKISVQPHENGMHGAVGINTFCVCSVHTWARLFHSLPFSTNIVFSLFTACFRSFQIVQLENQMLKLQIVFYRSWSCSAFTFSISFTYDDKDDDGDNDHHDDGDDILTYYYCYFFIFATSQSLGAVCFWVHRLKWSIE